MIREHYNNSIENGCIFHAPLTTDSSDIIGAKMSIEEAVSYNQDGAYFNDTSTRSKKYLAYELNEREFKSAKTLYVEFKRTTDKYETMTILCLCGLTGNVYDHTSQVKDGLIRAYMNVWHNLFCMMGKYSKNDGNVWKYDFDEVSGETVSKNVFHKAALGVYHDRHHLWIDGTRVLLTTATDTFSDYDFTPNPQTGLYLFVGGRTYTDNPKGFEGHVRNVMMFNKEFSDSELAAMTSL